MLAAVAPRGAGTRRAAKFTTEKTLVGARTTGTNMCIASNYTSPNGGEREGNAYDGDGL